MFVKGQANIRTFTRTLNMINCFFGCMYQQLVRIQTYNFVFFEASKKLLAQWLPFQKIFCRRWNNKTKVSFDITFWSPIAFVCYNTYLLFDLKNNTNFSFYCLRTKFPPCLYVFQRDAFAFRLQLSKFPNPSTCRLAALPKYNLPSMERQNKGEF